MLKLLLIHAGLFYLLYFAPGHWKRIRMRLGLTRRGEKLFCELSGGIPGVAGFSPPDCSKDRLRYKFYPGVIQELLELNQRWGTPLQEPWRQLKRHLQMDLQWHKRVEALIKEIFLHQALMSAMVLLFSWSFESLNPGQSTLLGLGVFYLFGLFAMAWLLRVLIGRALGEGPLFWRGLIRLEIFAKAQLSVQETLAKSEVETSLKGRDPDLKAVRKALETAIDSWQKTGSPLGDVLYDLRQEYAFIVEQKMELFLKRLKGLQIAMGLVFILPSFFYVISLHMGQFLLE